MPMIDKKLKFGTDITITQYPCPKCGSNLHKIKGKKGFFWGCQGYPSCKATYPNNRNKPMLDWE